MSIPLLTQVYDETRRLAIAGSVVAPGDFRLKKLLPALEQTGRKAPVFAKVAEAAGRLVESTEKTSAAALLELSTLVNAILYTQGETGIEGKIEPIPTTDLGQQTTRASARMLKPLLEALTTTGSGRLELIRDAHERGAFRDLRLISPALAAIDDTYSEIGDFVAREILPLYGRAILPELQAKFNPKGRGGDVRRLTLMHRLDPSGSRDYVMRALEDGSKEVRIAAIACLGDSPDDIPFLLEQAKAKAKDVREAALNALGKSDADAAVQRLCNAIAGADLPLAVEPVRASRNAKVTAFLLDAARKQLESLLAGKEKDQKKLGQANERLRLLLDCFRDRDDSENEKFLLDAFAQCEKLATIKGEPSGKDVVESLVSVMVSGSPKVQRVLVDAHATLPAESLGLAFVAACESRPPAEVFEMFSRYLTAKVNEKKKREPAYLKREAIIQALTSGPPRWYIDAYHMTVHELNILTELDSRWLDVAVKLNRGDLVQTLAVPDHADANALLSKNFAEALKKSQLYDLVEILSTMVRVGHPEATDAVIAVLNKSAKLSYTYGLFWIPHLIRKLPKDEAVPKLEALLPTLPEKMVDQVLDYVTELKNAPVA